MAGRRIKRPALELVVVEWMDSHYRPGWTTNGPELEPVRVTSVGWVVAKNPQAVVLCGHLTNEGDQQRCGDMTIARRAILKMERMK